MALWSNRGLGTTCLILKNESVARLEAGGCRNQGTYETVVGWREYVYRVWRVYALEAVLIVKWHTRTHALTFHTVPAFSFLLSKDKTSRQTRSARRRSIESGPGFAIIFRCTQHRPDPSPM
jgi:hypothetical protein